MNETIVSSDWLNNNITEDNLILLDAGQATNKSGVLPTINNIQIPGARGFDIKKDFSLKSTGLPNMMPDPIEFEKNCRKIGINKSSRIVVYDNIGNYFSPRVWWMFRAMGHKEVAVLDGGLPNWISKGFRTEERKFSSHKIGNFCSSFNKDAIRDFNFIQKNIQTREFLLIDARTTKRFQAKAPEPRKGIKSGSIPYSINLPFEEVLENGKYKNREELIAIFKSLNIGNQPLIFSCGSGITACIILLACAMVCKNNISLYDGSWTEWAERTQN